MQPLDLASTLPALFGGGSSASPPKKQHTLGATALAESKKKQEDTHAPPHSLVETASATKAAALAVSRLGKRNLGIRFARGGISAAMFSACDAAPRTLLTLVHLRAGSCPPSFAAFVVNSPVDPIYM